VLVTGDAALHQEEFDVARLVRAKAAPFAVRWVRRFLQAPASDEPLADQTRRFCEQLERAGRYEEWQRR